MEKLIVKDEYEKAMKLIERNIKFFFGRGKISGFLDKPIYIQPNNKSSISSGCS